MLTRPTLRPDLTAWIVQPDQVFLLSESARSLLQGALYVALAPLLDGARSSDALVDALAEQFSAAEVYYGLLVLESKGFLVEADASLPPSNAAFWSSLDGVATLEAPRTLLTGRVGMTNLSARPEVADLIVEALASLGLSVTAEADLSVVVVDDYLDPRLVEANARAIATGKPWLLVKPAGRVVWLGPLFRPGRTGCWACLAQRLRANRPTEAFLERCATQVPLREPATGHGPSSHASVAGLPTTLRLAVNLAATEAAKALVRGDASDLDGRVLTIDLGTLDLRWHGLVRRPQCPACGDPNFTRPAATTLSRAEDAADPAGRTNDELGRAASAEETLRRYEHHVSPVTGVVSFLQRTSPTDDPLVHTYVAAHGAIAAPTGVAGVREFLQGNAGGKGTTDAAARASALAEAIERYCGWFHGDEPRRRAALLELGGAAIHPATCLLYSERQYADRAAWNARPGRFQRVPVPFDEAVPIEWTPLWSLTRRDVVYLPTAYCYFRYPPSADGASCWADSNGCAAGSSRADAILRGLLELVERDSAALWWYNRARRPAIALDDLDDPYLQRVRRAYQARGRELWALDLTSDLGIPVAAAVSRRIEGEPEAILFGLGAHLDPSVAIRRAVVEMNQLLVGEEAIEEGRAPRPEEREPEVVAWLRTATLADQRYLAPDEAAPARSLADLPNLRGNDAKEGGRLCQGILEARGLELLVLDQTRPDVGMPVARVVVPGLRHFWARLAPGRLYDVPARLGWLPRPLSEDALNPIPITL